MILCGFEGCRGGNFSRPYRNFSPPPREFFPPPLWGDIIFHHRRPSALPKLIFKKINSGSGENYIPPPGGSSFGLSTALVFGNPVKIFYRVFSLYENLQGACWLSSALSLPDADKQTPQSAPMGSRSACLNAVN